MTEMNKPFNAELATELSILTHNLCKNQCPHDIGIKLAQAVAEFYAKTPYSEEIRYEPTD
jgi:hypothetical protein